MPGITASIVTAPNSFSMVNNEMWYQLTTSTSSSNFTNFKYVVDLTTTDQATGATSASLGRYLLPPRPVNGDGLFSPAKMLRTQISQDLTTFTNTITPCTQSVVPYHINVGHSYNLSQQSFIIGDAAILAIVFATYSNYFGIIAATQTPLVSAGDIITFAKTNNAINPQFNGTFTVLASTVTGFGNTFVLNVPWIGTPTSEVAFPAGYITSIVHPGTVPSTTLYGLNGTRQYTERTTNFGTLYQISSPKPALTHYNTGSTGATTSTNLAPGVQKPIFNFQSESLHILVEPISVTPSYVDYVLYNSNWNTLASVTGQFATVSHFLPYRRWSIPSGTNYLNSIGLTPSSYTDAKYYMVGLNDGFNFYMKYYYKIECNPSPNPNVRLTWLNPLGGMDHWNFNWKSVNTTQISGTEYKRILPWNYSVGERGTSILSVVANDTMTITTDFLTDFQSNWLKELAMTKEAWVIDETTNQFLPIIIDRGSYVRKTKLNDKLFSVTISFKYSYNINTQTA